MKFRSWERKFSLRLRGIPVIRVRVIEVLRYLFTVAIKILYSEAPTRARS